MNSEDYTLSILYVDDEPQALKYFAKAYSKHFKIHTCESAQDALDLLEQQSNEIGVLITDQRMPNFTGVNLLEKVRSQYPHIVRILTTAYAELDNAIDAVNEGSVFRYITKPWNLDELRGVLKNAMDYATVSEERDQLLQEKLSTIQRVLIMERTRYLAVIASALSNVYRNATSAARDFVMLSNLAKIPVSRIKNLINMDLSLCGPQETKKMTALAAQATAQAKPMDPRINHTINITEWTQSLLNELGTDAKLESHCPDLTITVNPDMLKKAVKSLVNAIKCDTMKGTLDKHGSDTHLAFTLTADNGVGFDSLFSILRNASVSEPFDESVFMAFFPIYHHGGHIRIEETTNEKYLKIVLPITQDEIVLDDPSNYDWIDDVFDILETAGY